MEKYSLVPGLTRSINLSWYDAKNGQEIGSGSDSFKFATLQGSFPRLAQLPQVCGGLLVGGSRSERGPIRCKLTLPKLSSGPGPAWGCRRHILHIYALPTLLMRTSWSASPATTRNRSPSLFQSSELEQVEALTATKWPGLNSVSIMATAVHVCLPPVLSIRVNGHAPDTSGGLWAWRRQVKAETVREHAPPRRKRKRRNLDSSSMSCARHTRLLLFEPRELSMWRHHCSGMYILF